jgi:hypothetical protein
MSEQQINLNFDEQGLQPIELVVTFRGKQYILLEADEDTAIRYKDLGLAAARWLPGDNGQPRQASLNGLSKTESFLVSRCLFYAKMVKNENTGEVTPTLPTLPNGDADRKQLVPEAIILKWQHRIVRPIFEECVRISKLSQKEQEKQQYSTKEDLEKRVKELEKELEETKLKLEKTVALEEGSENPEGNPTMDTEESLVDVTN